jgi:outer membrane protein assembly factor BamB
MKRKRRRSRRRASRRPFLLFSRPRLSRPRSARARSFRSPPASSRLGRSRLGRSWLGRLRPATRRRLLIGAAVLVLLCLPVPGAPLDGAPQAIACGGCRSQPAAAERWTAQPLPGTWTTSATAGTEPAFGPAYVAIGGGIAVVGAGLTLAGYAAADGRERWQQVLPAPDGTVIMSVRAWAGVVTVGLLAPGGNSRTEVVIDAVTGTELRRYPAAVFGGAVAASREATVIVGPAGVTGYDNATGRQRWRHPASGSRSWQSDGRNLYLAEYGGGSSPGASQVTALTVINLDTGAQRVLGSPIGQPFTGSLAIAADGAVLFASASGVTAYGGSTGDALWSRPGSIPEGTDPGKHLVYLAADDGTFSGVDPLTGALRTSVSAAAATGTAGGMYVVRGGVALGLQGGANGQALGYDIAAGKVAWTAPQLPWPHFFADVSGLGGSAEAGGNLVVVTACARLAVAGGLCITPELVAFALLVPRGQGKWDL